MDVRLAVRADLPDVLALLDALFVGHLPAGDRGEGFLSVRFTLSELEGMVAGGAIVAAIDEGRVVGALCAEPWTRGAPGGVLGAMSRAIERASFEGRPLASRRILIYGPVAIAPSHRGRHLLRRLYETVLRFGAGRWEVGAAFVAHANPHSMRAHVEALGMARVTEFESDGHGYALLAFPFPTEAAPSRTK
jgi:hypothetical protein